VTTWSQPATGNGGGLLRAVVVRVSLPKKVRTIVSATADFYMECIVNDCLPLSDDTWNYLSRDDIQELTDEIYEVSEFHFTSRFGKTHLIEGISLQFARRLDRLGLAVTEIKDLLELADDCLAVWEGN
jgi:hypothetical protein